MITPNRYERSLQLGMEALRNIGQFNQPVSNDPMDIGEADVCVVAYEEVPEGESRALFLVPCAFPGCRVYGGVSAVRTEENDGKVSTVKARGIMEKCGWLWVGPHKYVCPQHAALVIRLTGAE